MPPLRLVPRSSELYLRCFRHTSIRVGLVFYLLIISEISSIPVQAQELEPRIHANLPIGMNFLVAGYVYSEGGVSTDAASPIQNADLKIDSQVLAYARSLNLFGNASKLDLILPSACLSGSAEVAGVSRERNVCGLYDPRVRLVTNFYGAPALSTKEFAAYVQDTILGASLQLGAPLGQYDADKLVNIGNNRWLIKPEFGASKKVGSFTLESSTAVSFYTENDNFFVGQQRQQEPIYSIETHLVYGHSSGIWGSLDANLYWGGRTTVAGVQNDDFQGNQRLGLTLGVPINRHHSIKLYASSGVYARTDNNYDSAGVSWQYRWADEAS
jgi:hypothetical protein